MSLEYLNGVIGEALELLMDACAEVKDNQRIHEEPSLKHLGRAVMCLNLVREDIYEISPVLKPDFVSELNRDKERWNRLEQLLSKAKGAEGRKNSLAKKYYRELLSLASFGHFKRIAEAGLYRVGRAEEEPGSEYQEEVNGRK